MTDAIETVARAIADANGDDFDKLPKHKRDWIDQRGGEPYRDINQPFQSDYLDMAEAAMKAHPTLTALQSIVVRYEASPTASIYGAWAEIIAAMEAAGYGAFGAGKMGDG